MNVLMPVPTTRTLDLLFKPDISPIYGFQAVCSDVYIFFTAPFEKLGIWRVNPAFSTAQDAFVSHAGDFRLCRCLNRFSGWNRGRSHKALSRHSQDRQI